MPSAPKQRAVSPRFKRLGVACFEGHWETDMRTRQSVLPVLEFLDQAGWIRFFHRPVATKDQFLRDFKAWATQKRYQDYEVAFVATHGDTEALCFDDGDLPLGELADELSPSLRGRIVYFGSCSTAADAPDVRTRRFRRVLKGFREATGARAACGYVRDVDFSEAAAFEILLFGWLADYRQRSRAFARLYHEYRDLTEVLGFVVDPAPGSSRRRRAA